MSDLLERAPLAGARISAYAPKSPLPFDCDSEEALELRFGGPTRKRHEDLTYEFTRDPGLLHQYYRIRQQIALTTYGVHSGEESEHDRKGQILIVKHGKNECVGGVRLSFKTPRLPELLPMEINDFRIEKYFPYLGQQQLSYVQASWFTLLPQFHGGEITQKMIERVFSKASAMNAEILFGVAPILNARTYVQHFKALRLKEAKVHYNIELPSYPTLEEVKLYLISAIVEKSLSNERFAHAHLSTDLIH